MQTHTTSKAERLGFVPKNIGRTAAKSAEELYAELTQNTGGPMELGTKSGSETVSRKCDTASSTSAM